MFDLLRALAIFARAVEAGSFRAAAKAEGLAPSVVSHHVAKLEERLGLPLIYRSTRRMSLTPSGAKLFASARAMLNAAETGLDAVTSEARQPGGDLRVTAPAVLASGSLIDDIAAFAVKFPRVRLMLDFSDIRRDIVSGGVDVAVRMGRLEDSALKSRRLGEAERILVASARYAAAKSTPHSPADLATWDWLRLKGVHDSARAVFRHRTKGAASVAVDARMVVDDAIALYRLALSGLGLASVPRFLAERDIAAGLVVEILPAWRLGALGIHAVWPANAPRGGLISLFVAFLVDRGIARSAGG